MDSPPRAPPSRRKGGELPVGHRIAIAVEVALAIPSGKVRVPKGAMGAICEEYGVGHQYPSRLWLDVNSQIDASQSVDLSSKERKERPSLLTLTKVAALKKVNKQNQ